MILAATLMLALAQSSPPEPPSDEIVVTGLRDIDQPGSPVTRKTMNSQRPFLSPGVSRSMLGFSQRFARCALGPRADLKLLRQALDGRINSSAQFAAQQRLVRSHSACTENPTAVRSSGFGSRVASATASPVFDLGFNPAKGDISGGAVPVYDTTYYDRGALFIEAIRTFAPDLSLTTASLFEPAVQERFNRRETSLAKFRFKSDRKYLAIALCLVRQQPQLAVELVKTDGPPGRIEKLEGAIVNRARACVGGARRVYFDPAQFRFYIAEAVYRWAVAARAGDSLIPEG